MNNNESQLEHRVGKLEIGLEEVTKAVAELSKIIK